MRNGVARSRRRNLFKPLQVAWSSRRGVVKSTSAANRDSPAVESSAASVIGAEHGGSCGPGGTHVRAPWAGQRPRERSPPFGRTRSPQPDSHASLWYRCQLGRTSGYIPPMSSSLTTTVVITIALLAGGNASPPIRRSPTADVPTSASTVSSSLVSSVSTAFHPLSRAESAPARTSTSATSPSWPAAAVVSPSPTPTWTSTKSLTGASRLSPCLPVDLAVPLLALVLMALSGAIVTGDEEPAPRPTTPPPRPIADRRRGRLLVGKANAFAQVQRRAAARRPPWRP